MKKAFILSLLVLTIKLVSCQGLSFEWGFGIGGNLGEAHQLRITTDTTGNVYSLGYFFGTVDFQPGFGIYNMTTTLFANSIYVAKYSFAGSLMWCKALSGDYHLAEDIQVDQLGNVYLTGTFGGSVDFDPGPTVNNLTSSGTRDIFLLKLNANGEFDWIKQFGSSVVQNVYEELETGNCLNLDTLGNVYMVGTFLDTTDFDPGPAAYNLISNGGMDGYAVKLSSSGSFIWARQIGGIGDDFIDQVTVDQFNNVFLAGNVEGIVDINTGTGVQLTDTSSAFVLKLDAQGTYEWGYNYNALSVSSMVTDDSGNFYATGRFWGIVDFDSDTSIYEIQATGFINGSVYLLKVDSSGSFSWVRDVHVLGGFWDSWSGTVALDQNSNVYMSATTQFPTDVLNGTPILILTNCFLMVYDESGNFQNGRGLPGLFRIPETRSFCIDKYDNLLVTGQGYGGMDLDPGSGTTLIPDLTTDGDYSYVIKLSTCEATSGTHTFSVCEGEDLPSGNSVYGISGNYIDVIESSAGCDSILYIDATVAPRTYDTIEVFQCTYTSPSGNYVWNQTGTYRDTIQNAAGCDSVITVLLDSESSSYHYLNACDSLISPSGNYTWYTSGYHVDTLFNANYLGCDSILVVSVSIAYSTADTVVADVCEPYLFDGTLLSTSGTYEAIRQAANGCDSIEVLELTVTIVDTSLIQVGSTLTANLAGASYQWVDCNNSFAPVVGATTQSFSTTVPSSYAVIVSQNACSDTSPCYTITSLTDAITEDNNFKIYPNPVSDILFIEMTGGEPYSIECFNTLGQLVIQETIDNSGKGRLNLNQLPAGKYVLRITSRTGVSNHPLLKD